MDAGMGPRGESLRQAVRWISAERETRPEAPLGPIVQAACARFDLGPLDEKALWETFVTHHPGSGLA